MDSETQIKLRKVLLLHRQKVSNETNDSFVRLSKALAGFCEVEEKELADTLNVDDLREYSANYFHIFLELSHFPSDKETEVIPNITLFQKESFLWNTPKSREVLLPSIAKYGCLVLGKTSTVELLRILHLYLLPKRGAGVTSLMEKGSLILGEKIQSLDNIGALVDKLQTHFQHQDNPIAARAFDMRQIVESMVNEAFRCASETGSLYPTIDFQCSSNKEKIAFNIRFPAGKLVAADLPNMILDARDIAWHLSWQCADQFYITHHEQYNEIEVFAVIYPAKRNAIVQFKSFLFSKKAKSPAAENLLFAPKQFEFSLISEIKANHVEPTHQVVQSLETLQNDFNEELIPESVREKISLQEKQKTLLKTMLDGKEEQIKDLSTKLNLASREIVQKRNEILMHIRELDSVKDKSKLKHSELEKRLEFFSQSLKEQQSKVVTSPNLQATVQELELKLRISEKEKTTAIEKSQLEQKKITSYEQKYSNIFKEIAARDKEVQELKALIEKLRKTQSQVAATPGTAAAAVAPTGGDAQSKLKEYEAREVALKQELKKFMFKAENSEKNVKAIQDQAAEKLKLIEKKFEASKAKEIELNKKIEELNAQLKKTKKAA